jgi:hypothetical protein
MAESIELHSQIDVVSESAIDAHRPKLRESARQDYQSRSVVHERILTTEAVGTQVIATKWLINAATELASGNQSKPKVVILDPNDSTIRGKTTNRLIGSAPNKTRGEDKVVLCDFLSLSLSRWELKLC